VERVLANIDADHGDCAVALLRHGVLLVFAALGQLLSLAGREHGRAIPLPDIAKEEGASRRRREPKRQSTEIVASQRRKAQPERPSEVLA
jgi:hypothetical protein